jgi:hypothetical protein
MKFKELGIGEKFITTGSITAWSYWAYEKKSGSSAYDLIHDERGDFVRSGKIFSRKIFSSFKPNKTVYKLA